MGFWKLLDDPGGSGGYRLARRSDGMGGTRIDKHGTGESKTFHGLVAEPRKFFLDGLYQWNNSIGNDDDSLMDYDNRDSSDSEVEETVQDFIKCAKLASQAGYDGVEIMGSEGYLINQFIVEHTKSGLGY